MTHRIAVLGEPLLELSTSQGQVFGTSRFSFAGDTLNTAVYLARFGVDVEYVTALGLDAYSQALLAGMQAEGIGTELVLRHPTRVPGLYAIQTDTEGERSFTYWRNESAARDFFNLAGCDDALNAVQDYDALYLSGITLSLFDEAGRQKLAILANEMRRAGKPVVFDPNYREKGWHTPEEARQAFAQFAQHATLVLPTRDDERALYGQHETIEYARAWQTLGASTVVLKCGSEGAYVFTPGQAERHVPVPAVISPTDTTGAGDAFNAAFLNRSLLGARPEEAVHAGHVLASRVIQTRGAILPLQLMPATNIAGEIA
ncbi:MAG: sugar kinase [Hyphomonadaceae bacterium]|nr:sugar kinase [Hyphomonadaceae bacterium]